jgi:hypothetical protein
VHVMQCSTSAVEVLSGQAVACDKVLLC